MKTSKHLSRSHRMSSRCLLRSSLRILWVMRGKDYALLDHPVVQARLHLPADTHFNRPESGLVRQPYDWPDVPAGKENCRIVVATHLAAAKNCRIGQTREGVVYELFFTPKIA